MESVMISLFPLVLLWVAFSLVTGRSLSPQAVVRGIFSLMWRMVRLLWRRRQEHSGAGRTNRPRPRYRPFDGEPR